MRHFIAVIMEIILILNNKYICKYYHSFHLFHKIQMKSSFDSCRINLTHFLNFFLKSKIEEDFENKMNQNERMESSTF